MSNLTEKSPILIIGKSWISTWSLARADNRPTTTPLSLFNKLLLLYLCCVTGEMTPVEHKQICTSDHKCHWVDSLSSPAQQGTYHRVDPPWQAETCRYVQVISRWSPSTQRSEHRGHTGVKRNKDWGDRSRLGCVQVCQSRVSPSRPWLSGRRLTLSCADLSSVCRTSMLLFSFLISFSRWHISSRSTTMPSSTTLAISATAALDKASTTEAIWARRATLLSIVRKNKQVSDRLNFEERKVSLARL